ncbi:hypothetical protein B0H66DRAFT_335571 [Apodospora peruviana]|uniref:Oxidoreductase AflY n=1 Tax=Apodospora peruviana TaxID=516989 RepID=A0AAE0HYC1_9PEZI|nr:hypothetical protein B0H66DRAFT_335571 [Apodospora peruviana]
MALPPISLSPDHLGITRTVLGLPDAHTLDTASRLLQKNHDELNMFWRDAGGHNHIVHSILTAVAFGGSAADVQRAYDDGVDTQRPRVPANPQLASQLSDPVVFAAHMGDLAQYTTFLAFFEQLIREQGSWRPVVAEYYFGRTALADTMLARLFEGLFHPLIHLGLGIEFDLPAVVAEALAMTACHNSDGIDNFFFECERIASATSASPSKPLVVLLNETRANDKIRHATLPTDGPACVKDGVLGRAGPEMAALAAQYCVAPDNAGLRRATAEGISCAAYTAGASAQRPGKRNPVIDFFYLHNVTSSIFLTVLGRQEWINVADRARLVEWKARLDLVWYAASAAAALDREALLRYTPGPSAGMGWPELYRAVLAQHDDGHLAKFVRALKHGQDVEEEDGGDRIQDYDVLPVRGELWLRIAQMAYDSTVDKVEVLDKWVFGTGFDDRWAGRL